MMDLWWLNRFSKSNRIFLTVLYSISAICIHSILLKFPSTAKIWKKFIKRITDRGTQSLRASCWTGHGHTTAENQIWKNYWPGSVYPISTSEHEGLLSPKYFTSKIWLATCCILKVPNFHCRIFAEASTHSMITYLSKKRIHRADWRAMERYNNLLYNLICNHSLPARHIARHHVSLPPWSYQICAGYIQQSAEVRITVVVCMHAGEERKVSIWRLDWDDPVWMTYLLQFYAPLSDRCNTVPTTPPSLIIIVTLVLLTKSLICHPGSRMRLFVRNTSYIIQNDIQYDTFCEGHRPQAQCCTVYVTMTLDKLESSLCTDRVSIAWD